MALPFFYSNEIVPSSEVLMLEEETSRHVVQVLRMEKGEHLNLTDGKGSLFLATIVEAHKKKCSVSIDSRSFHPRVGRKVTIAISLLKNANRFEWFLEKATEIGILTVIPLICTRTEKHHFRHDRMLNILISAMLQSQQVWLPEMTQASNFNSVLSVSTNAKFIAHCESESDKISLAAMSIADESIIMIGPEGDFTATEIQHAKDAGFKPVSLGDTRLRTETAGMVAAALLRNIND